jgi:hypothetical protein
MTVQPVLSRPRTSPATSPVRGALPAPAVLGAPPAPAVLGAPPARTAAPGRSPGQAGPLAATDTEVARQIRDFEQLLAGLPLGPVVLIDAPGRRLLVNGAEVPLTLQEFDLVLYLARAAGRVVTRDELYQAAWHRQTLSPATRTVDVHVRRVRAKSGLDGLITTVRGVGYRLNPIDDLHLVD